MTNIRSRNFTYILAAVVSLLGFELRLRAADGLTISWTNNLLTVSSANLPGGTLEILYLEAFCRSGSTRRDWRQTTLPHKTSLVSASKDQKRLELLTRVEPNVEARHELRASADEVEFNFQITNKGSEPV